MKKYLFIPIYFFFILNLTYNIFPCTMILVGKDASTDGSVFLAHNNDLPGDIASLINITPAQKHHIGENIDFKNGLFLPQASQTYRMLMMSCYYGFSEGDAKAINEYQVAIAGGTSLKEDRNDRARELDPLIKGGVTGYVRYIALQRSKTARECVEFIGQMYSQYGIAYPSGVGVADPNEIWYIEAGGGKCWAAQRIPDNSYLVVANGYRIGEINPNDKKNFIIPPYLIDYALEKGLWKPGKQFFNFAKVFGGKKRKQGSYYNTRRIWRVQRLLTPSFKQSPDFSLNPMTLEPDEKVSLSKLIEILRDYYKGTPFDVSTTKNSSPQESERAIGVFNTVHTSIIQLRGNLPADIGAVLWGGLSSSLTTPYIPYYIGIKKVHSLYRTAGPKFSDDSAFWQFNRLTKLLRSRFPQLIRKILPVWQNFESKSLALQQEIERVALELYKKDKELAKDFLTFYCSGISNSAVEKVKQLCQKLKN